MHFSWNNFSVYFKTILIGVFGHKKCNTLDEYSRALKLSWPESFSSLKMSFLVEINECFFLKQQKHTIPGFDQLFLKHGESKDLKLSNLENMFCGQTSHLIKNKMFKELAIFLNVLYFLNILLRERELEIYLIWGAIWPPLC